MAARKTDARRAIAWKDLDASALDPAKRRVVGASWKERARQEHLAVGAFALLTQELAADGCDPVVLALVTKAAWDEVRHAEICRNMAVALLGARDVPARYKGLPKVPKHDSLDARTRTLLHVTEMCCLSETITGVDFTEMRARATNPIVRGVIASLLEDELDHGRLGWAYLGTRHREGSLDGLSNALPAIFDRTAVRAISAPPDSQDDVAMEAFGFLGHDAATAAVKRAIDEVILPGFETLDIDTRDVRAHLDAQKH